MGWNKLAKGPDLAHSIVFRLAKPTCPTLAPQMQREAIGNLKACSWLYFGKQSLLLNLALNASLSGTASTQDLLQKAVFAVSAGFKFMLRPMPHFQWESLQP